MAAHGAAYNNKKGKKSSGRKMKPERKVIQGKRFYDWYLLAYIILILCFGLIMLFSASVYSEQAVLGKAGFFFFKQLKYSLGGIVGMLIVSSLAFNSRWLVPMSWLMYIISLIMMVLVPEIGIESHHAKRWLEVFGVSIQPSEIAKIAVVMIIPSRIVKLEKKALKKPGSVRPGSVFLNVLLIGGIPAAMAWKLTDNLSTGIIIICIAFGIYVMSKPKPLPYIIGGIALLAILYYISYQMAGSLAQSVVSEADIGSFRKRRLAAWRDPYKFISGSGWQVIQGLYAIGSGGWLGKGLGRSTQKFNNIPEAQNDFIFPIICEEMGLFGALLVVLLFLAILYRLLYLAGNTRNRYAYYILMGIFFHISIQSIFNIAVVLNLIPTTGVSLPFISSGGTALVLLLLEMGVALCISRGIVLKKA